MAVQVLPAPARVFSSIAGLLPGARAYFYESGTSTLETVYSDEALTVPHDSPVDANAAGVFPQVFHSGAPALKCVITDSSGNTVYTIDPVITTSLGSAASEIDFTPIAGNAATDVQTAIATVTAQALVNEQLSENAAIPVALTGGTTAYALAATDTVAAYAASQVYRFVVNAANTGAVTLNVDSLGAKSVKRYNNSASLVDLGANDWRIGETHAVVYDGTQFVMVTPIGAKTGGVRGVVEKATTAEAQAGTEADKFPDVVGVAAAITALQRPQVWGKITGTAGTPAAESATGIASVTDNGTGDYTINYSDAFSTANHQVAITVHGTGGVGGRSFVTVAPATGSCRVYITDINGTATDFDFNFIAFGTPA